MRATDASPSLSDPGLPSGVVESVQSLDNRMSSLEGKVGVSQASVEGRMSVLEKRMANVGGKLDVLLGQLNKGWRQSLPILNNTLKCLSTTLRNPQRINLLPVNTSWYITKTGR